MEITQQCFDDTRSNTPKATERTQAMLSILPVVVSEHFMLKERLRKWEPLTRTHLCGYAKQEKSSLHHSWWPPTCSATPTHSPFPPSSKDTGLPLWNDALKKVENTTYGKCVIFHQQPQEKAINYRGVWASDIKNNLFGEPKICFAVAAWFSSYYF